MAAVLFVLRTWSGRRRLALAGVALLAAPLAVAAGALVGTILLALLSPP